MNSINLTEALCDALEADGVNLDDRKSFAQSLGKAMLQGNFKFIEKDGQQIGFIAWEPWGCDEGTAVFVHSLLVLKKYMPYNLHRFVTFFREKYPDCFKIYWHDNKKNARKEFLLPQREVVYG